MNNIITLPIGDWSNYYNVEKLKTPVKYEHIDTYERGSRDE